MNFVDSVKKASQEFITFDSVKIVAMVFAITIYFAFLIFILAFIGFLTHPLVSLFLIAPAFFSIFAFIEFLERIRKYWN